MTDRPYRIVPNPDGPRRHTIKVKLRPTTPGEQRALDIQRASLVRWLEERRQRLAGGQDNPTS
jgi:hypothetical protein